MGRIYGTQRLGLGVGIGDKRRALAGVILATWGCFDAAGNIDAPRCNRGNGAAYIIGGEATCQE